MQTLGSNAPSLNYADGRKRTVWPDAALPGMRANFGGVDLRAPYAAVAAIKDHVAFYPDRVDAIDEQLAARTRRALSMKTITI